MTREQRQKLNKEVRLHVQSGKTVAETARAFHLTEGLVQAILDMPEPEAGKPLTFLSKAERNEEIIRRVKAGETRRSVARKLNLSEGHVSSICCEAGIQTKGKRSEKMSRVQNREIIARVRSGETHRSVAADFGLSRTTVKNVCHAAGVRTRQIKRDRNREIMKRIENGESRTQVAKRFGLTRQQIYSIIYAQKK